MSKKFYIGIDSDGTAFDSMTPKHVLAFIPALFEVWDIPESIKEEVAEIEKKINLYSKERGVNRFPGLLRVFEEMDKKGLAKFDYSSLADFVEKGESMSNAALEKFIAENPADFLNEVLEWSRLSDKFFETETESLMPFKGVLPALKKAFPMADISVVSSASTAGLKTDWKKDSLSDYVTHLLGQDSGSKKQQLKSTADGNYAPENILMIGDAIGDMEAARSINALFYPIIPGKEEESWNKFTDEVLDIFFSGNYAGECEKAFIDEFLSVLC